MGSSGKDLPQELLGILSELSQALRSVLSAEVRMFLDVGGYGLALETFLCAIVSEEDKTIPRGTYTSG